MIINRGIKSYPFPDGLSGLYDFTEPLIENMLLRGGEALDIGCGDGSVSCFMLSKGIKHVTAFDISKRVIDKARSEHQGPAYFVGDAENLHFILSLGLFDFILIRNTFHHFRNKEQFLHTIAKLIRAEGVLLLIDLDYESNFCFLGVLATHLRFFCTHNPSRSLKMLKKTRLFLDKPMRKHRKADRLLLKQQGWYKKRDIEKKITNALPGMRYFRIGEILGYGGAYVSWWKKEGDPE